MPLPVASTLHPSLCDCCAVNVHTKDMPKKHKNLNYIVPIHRTCQEGGVEAPWRGWWCSGVEDLSIRRLGRIGAEEGCAGGGTQQNVHWEGGNLHVETWGYLNNNTMKWQFMAQLNPVTPCVVLCCQTLFKQNSSLLLLTASQGKSTDLLGEKLPFNPAGISSRPSKVWEQCCSREMGSVSISFLYILLELLNKLT